MIKIQQGLFHKCHFEVIVCRLNIRCLVVTCSFIPFNLNWGCLNAQRCSQLYFIIFSVSAKLFYFLLIPRYSGWVQQPVHQWRCAIRIMLEFDLGTSGLLALLSESKPRLAVNFRIDSQHVSWVQSISWNSAITRSQVTGDERSTLYKYQKSTLELRK